MQSEKAYCWSERPKIFQVNTHFFGGDLLSTTGLFFDSNQKKEAIVRLEIMNNSHLSLGKGSCYLLKASQESTHDAKPHTRVSNFAILLWPPPLLCHPTIFSFQTAKRWYFFHKRTNAHVPPGKLSFSFTWKLKSSLIHIKSLFQRWMPTLSWEYKAKTGFQDPTFWVLCKCYYEFPKWKLNSMSWLLPLKWPLSSCGLPNTKAFQENWKHTVSRQAEWKHWGVATPGPGDPVPHSLCSVTTNSWPWNPGTLSFQPLCMFLQPCLCAGIGYSSNTSFGVLVPQIRGPGFEPWLWLSYLDWLWLQLWPGQHRGTELADGKPLSVLVSLAFQCNETFQSIYFFFFF